MATLRDIKQRIVSVQSTRQITRTMEMVATAKIAGPRTASRTRGPMLSRSRMFSATSCATCPT